MPSRICETNGWLPERKKRKRTSGNFVLVRNRRYRSGKVTGHAYAMASIGVVRLDTSLFLLQGEGSPLLEIRERQIETLAAT